MNIKAFIQRHPITTYFATVYIACLLSFLAVAGPGLIQGKSMQAANALTMFPMIIIEVFLTGIILTSIVDGKSGLRNLRTRMGTWHVSLQWYAAALLIPPVFIFVILLILRTLVSPIFTPHFFLLGTLFGIPAGFFEEVGWMGYVFPKLRLKYNALTASILLGVLWGLWHLPVIDFLGAASPHGIYWLPFVLAFIAVLCAIRALIVWIYSNTNSILLAQIMHASSTGFLVVLSPFAVSAAQETLWYGVYAAVLWIMVVLVAIRYGNNFVRQPMQVKTAQATSN